MRAQTSAAAGVSKHRLTGGGERSVCKTTQDASEAAFNAASRASEVPSPADFKGDVDALRTVLDARPDVFNHNIETVRRLSRAVRPQSGYERSLGVLAEAKRLAPTILSKSGLMVGLGETEAEIGDAMRDLRAVDCDLLTIGQYLQPTRNHLPVLEYVPPTVFTAYSALGRSLGFRHVASGPFVRSSYHAEETFTAA